MTGNAWQMVTCRTCGDTYRCTPSRDYYNATTTTDGLCETCLAGGDEVRTIVIIPCTSQERP